MREKISRFIQYLEYKGINDNQATVDCGLSNGLIGQARSGKSDLGTKTIDKILSKYQDLSKVWLLTGEGSMLTQPENAMTEDPKDATFDFVIRHMARQYEELQAKYGDLELEYKELRQERDNLLKRNNELEIILARKKAIASAAVGSSDANAG